MSLRFLNHVLAVSAVLAASTSASAAPPLRFCADPDNLPFSSRTLAGFDNRIAGLMAHDLGRQPVFVWARARRGFLREQFNKGACDVLMGVPTGVKGVLTTVPYYRSTYVFVTRQQDHLRIASFSDPQLNARRIGLQIMEEDLSPPSLPLVRHGHAAQLVGYPSFGSAASGILRAVKTKQVGTAVVWGPLAGYYARTMQLALTPVSPPVDSGIPFVYSIAFAVHKNDTALRDQLSNAVTRESAAIHKTLLAYNVPLVSAQGSGSL